MMKCPYCGSLQNKVTDISTNKKKTDDSKRRRRRLCLVCNRKFWTIEEYIPMRRDHKS